MYDEMIFSLYIDFFPRHFDSKRCLRYFIPLAKLRWGILSWSVISKFGNLRLTKWITNDH